TSRGTSRVAVIHERDDALADRIGRFPQYRVGAAGKQHQLARRQRRRERLSVYANIRRLAVQREHRAADRLPRDRRRGAQIVDERRALDERLGLLRESRALAIAVTTELTLKALGDLSVARFALEAERRGHLRGPAFGTGVRVDQCEPRDAIRV